MSESIEAVYECGVFRPLSPFAAEEGTRVVLQVERDDASFSNDFLKVAGSVYDGLSDEQIRELEKHIQRRQAFFGRATLL